MKLLAIATNRNFCIVAMAACVALACTTSTVTAQELLGYWQFEETSVDDAAVDSSGNGHDGEFEGEVDPNVDGAPGFGSGLFLDGIDGQVFLGPGDENGFGELTSDFSVMAWINPDQFDSKNRVFGSVPWEANSGWGWGTNGDQIEITTWGVKDYDDGGPLEIDEWTHVAIVMDDDFSAHFYENGEFIGTQEHAAEGGETVNDFYIGYAAVAGRLSCVDR
ncbi:LamG-like jellyroll fold domain-containing protein, partial [Planctomycetota bacterium]